ncbi:unnamed protein product, partial [Effrenium voratum]
MPVPSDWEPLRLSSEKSRLSFQDNAPENEPVEPEMVAVNTDGVVAVNVSFEKCRWDFFLSHKQSNAQDAVQNLRLALGEKFLGASFWLDIEQDPTVKGMCHGVSHSKNVLVFLTEGITDSKFCQMEMRWALAAKRNIILVMETDERHGKPDMEQLIRRCPNDLKQIFEGEIIPWFRDPEFRAVSVEKIIRSIAKDPRTEVREKSKPLMYGKSSGEDAEGAEVFDRSFVIFTAMCGVALPGAGPRTRCWAVAVRIILLTCGMMCCSRIFTPEGPGFYDYETIVQIVAAHPMIFLLLHVMLVLLRSDLIADLLDNHIDCASEGQKLRFKTKILTALVALLTATLSLWGWAGALAIRSGPNQGPVPPSAPSPIFSWGGPGGVGWGGPKKVDTYPCLGRFPSCRAVFGPSLVAKRHLAAAPGHGSEGEVESSAVADRTFPAAGP